MELMLGQAKEVDGRLTMVRAVRLPVEDFKTMPEKQIKGILYGAYLQILEVERQHEVAELEKLAR